MWLSIIPVHRLASTKRLLHLQSPRIFNMDTFIIHSSINVPPCSPLPDKRILTWLLVLWLQQTGLDIYVPVREEMLYLMAIHGQKRSALGERSRGRSTCPLLSARIFWSKRANCAFLSSPIQYTQPTNTTVFRLTIMRTEPPTTAMKCVI